MNNKSKIIIGVIISVFLLTAIVVVSVNVTQVTVTGNNRYTSEQIQKILFPGQWDRNSVYCYYKNRFQEHEKIPFVEDYKIVFQGPTKVEVIIYEKSIVGYVSYMSSYMYFDKDGIIVESANTKLEGIPWITGLKFGHIILYQPLPLENRDIFNEILNLTQVLSIYQMPVDKIQYNSRGEATLNMGEIEVILGDNSDINGKIAELNDMLPELKGLSGTLHLDTYDETNSSMTYTFKKKN